MNRNILSKGLVYSIVLWSSILTVTGQVSQKIGGNPGTIDPKAVLELESTTKGFLLPRMTAAQVAAITNPTSGMMVFCTDCGVGSDGELRISYNGVWQTFKGNVTGNITGNAATVTTNANLTGPITSSGNTTSVASQTGTGSKFVMDNSPTFTGTPTLPTGTIGVTQTLGDNSTAIATTAFVTTANTTNANLTGPITSSGNATSVASQTGTGSTFVMNTSPTLVTPVLGAATATSINNTAIPASKTLVVTTDKLNVLSATSSTELAGVITDETGTGSVVLSNSPTFTGTVTAPIYASTPQALTDGNTITWNPTSGLNASVTLGGNRTLSFASTPAVGSYGTLIVTQDATGNRTITLPSSLTNKVLGSATSTIDLSTAPNAKDVLNFYYDGTNCYWNIGQGYGTDAPPVITNLATNVSGTLAVANGGSGATTLTGYVKGNGTSAMTANASIPVADVTGAAPLASPTFTGTPTLPTGTIGVTQTAGNNTTALATTAFVTAANTTNANLTGMVTSVGNATTVVTNANLTGAVTSTGNATSLGSFTSANLATALSDETGTGVAVLATSPTLVTPVLGAATATTINSTAIPTSKTLVVTTDKLNVLSATSSSELAGVISDETGTGNVVLSNSPTFTGSVTAPIYASTPQALTDAATISWNPTNGLNASVTLGGNRSLSFTSLPTVGSYGTLIVTQDGTGNRTITLPTTANKVLGSASTTTIALSTAANAKDILNFYYDGTNCYWNVGQGYGTAAPAVITNLATNVSGTLAVANGGTGATTLTGLVKGNGTGAMTAAVAGTDYVAPSGSITGNAATVTTNANLTGPITSSGNTTSVASQTGTGSTFVMNTSPTLVTPVLGAATATTINSTSIPTSKTLVVTTDKLNVLSATSSSELAGVISDETGTGSVVLSASPTFTGDAKAVTATAGDNDVSIATTEFVTSAITSANATNANLTGMVTSVGNATTVVTNANLTGVVTSTGNATAIADGALSIAKTNGLQTAIDAKVADAINDATTTVAPSQNAVFDALALKANLASPTFTGTVTAPIYASTPQALTYGSTINWNPTSGLNARVTLTGNGTLSFTTPPATGSYGTLVVTQDGTGNRTITLPGTSNKVLGSASTTAIALSTAANANDILNFYFDGTYYYWNVGQGYGTAAPAVITNLATNVSGILPVANGGTGAATLTGLVKGNGTGVMTAAVAGTDYVAPSGSITGNAATVTTNANLTGAVTSSGNATSLGSFTSANLATALSDETGTGVAVLATSPTLVTPVLGVATATSINSTSIPTSKTLVVTTDKLNVHAATSSTELAGVISDETGTGSLVLSASPTFTGDAKAVTATAGDNDVSIATTEFVTSAITSANATNANLTGMVTSVGNTTSLGSFTSANLATALSDETGSGVAVLATSPTLVTPVLGAATGTSLSVSGQLTSTVATGTAPLVVTSTTPVANLSIGGNAATVTTNANLTGVVTSTGNATAIADGALSIAKTNGLQTAIDAKVADAINDATTTVAPSQNAVFDALALKANLASPTFTGTVTAPIYASAPQALTYGSTINWNPASGLNASVTLTGNGTLSFTTPPATGSYGTLVVTQDGTGNRTITLPGTSNKVLGSASTTAIALSTAANANDILNFYFDGTYYYWNVGQGYGTAAPAVITNLATNVSGILPVANGGTGAATLTGIVKGNGTGVMTAAVAGTDYVAPSGSITGNAATVTTNANLSGVVTSSGNTTAIADGALSIAKTSGLQTAIDAKVADAINDATTTVAPSQNAVFDALALKANIAAPTFTGDAKAVTATVGDNDVSIATTAFVANALSTAVTAVGAISGTSNANGATINSGTLNLTAANATNGGVVTTGAQTFAGVKTFSSNGSFNGNSIGVGNATGGSNLAVGSGALNAASTGHRNTAIGNNAMLNYVGTGFDNNTSVGYSNLSALSTGSGNTSVGAESMTALTTGTSNTSIGNQALTLVTGSGNVGVGKSAGSGITTGSNNTLIGTNATSSLVSVTNSTAIGNGAIVALSNTIQLGADGSPGTIAITNVKTSGTLTAGTVTYPNTHNSSAGQILTVNASGTSTWAPPSATSMSGILPVANGGTGLTSFTSGGAVYATSTSALTTGTLPIASGGTGSTTQNFVDLTTAQTVAGNKTFSNTITAATIVKTGGTSAQFLMADGSVSSGTPLLTEADIEITATAGQTSFALTQIPSTLSKVKMYVNGIRISKTAYTISGSTLTYIPANNENYTITVGDRVQFEFAY